MKKNNISKIQLPDIDSLYCQRNVVFEEIRRNGCCVLQFSSSSLETLKNVASFFGCIQTHIRSDFEGIVSEREPVFTHWKKNKSEYFGIQNNEFSPHTDGSFLQGIHCCNSRIYKIEPPKLVLLQCVTPASVGGENVIMDGEDIALDILNDEPKLFHLLSQPGSISYCRDDQLAVNVSIFEKLKKARWRFRYRYDRTMFCSKKLKQYIVEFNSKYINNSKYCKQIKLEHGDILILDNYRVIHGRREFSSDSKSLEKRRMRRVWIGDNSNSLLENLVNDGSIRNAFLHYQPYRVFAESVEHNAKVPVLDLGIKL